MTRYKKTRAFTFIEMVIILIVLGIMAAFSFAAIANTVQNGRIKAAQSEMLIIQDAIMGTEKFRGYVQDVGSFPSNLSDLIASMAGGFNPYVGSGGTRGNYFSDIDLDGDATADILEDPWGNAYDWTSGTGVLYSYGPNGTDNSGGGDDIVITLPALT